MHCGGDGIFSFSGCKVMYKYDEKINKSKIKFLKFSFKSPG